MSKIQNALDKIQKSRRPAYQLSSSTDAGKTATVSKVVNKGRDKTLQARSGKCLHVDRNVLREAGLIAPECDEHLLENQYRDIKRPLIAHAFGKRATKIEDGNLIMLTSAFSGEGKTFTSINLAISMAQERDYSVLLVDADVAKPRTSEIFGAADEPGLLDALAETETNFQSLILPTDLDNLSLLPAGRPRQNATELLASDAMEIIVATMASLSSHQLVIFDSPPLLQTSEAKVLSSLAGQIVVVVKAEVTPQDAVCAAIGSLDQSKAINMILNQVRSGFGEYQYGLGFGYGYGKREQYGSVPNADTDIFE